jgi:hypothetical protein
MEARRRAAAMNLKNYVRFASLDDFVGGWRRIDEAPGGMASRREGKWTAAAAKTNLCAGCRALQSATTGYRVA